jgi:hypothetical protein
MSALRPGARIRGFGATNSRDPLETYTEAGVKNLCSTIVAEIEQLVASLDITDAASAAANLSRHERRLAITAEAFKAFQQ